MTDKKSIAFSVDANSLSGLQEGFQKIADHFDRRIARIETILSAQMDVNIIILDALIRKGVLDRERLFSILRELDRHRKDEAAGDFTRKHIEALSEDAHRRSHH